MNTACARPPGCTLRRALAAVGAVAATAAVAAACGLPTDSAPRAIPPEYSLDITPSSTVAPEVPSASGPAYYLTGPPDQPGTLVPVTRQVEPTGLAVIQSLFDGLTRAEQSDGLRTAIPEGTELLDARVLPDGTARIDVSDAVFGASRDTQTEAVAQIVFTATDAGASPGRAARQRQEAAVAPRGRHALRRPADPVHVPRAEPVQQARLPTVATRRWTRGHDRGARHHDDPGQVAGCPPYFGGAVAGRLSGPVLGPFVTSRGSSTPAERRFRCPLLPSVPPPRRPPKVPREPHGERDRG